MHKGKFGHFFDWEENISKSLFKNAWNLFLKRFPYPPDYFFLWSDQTLKKMYQTDLTETEWQYITKVLNLQERKRKYDLRLIWNAIFYLVKTGCQWRMLPLDFPKWQLVYYYYRKWASQLDFDLLLEKLRGHVRVKRGQSMAFLLPLWSP